MGDDHNKNADLEFSSAFTLFGGLRFDFNENIGFKGIFYYQDYSADVYDGGAGGVYLGALENPWGPRGGDHSIIRLGANQKWNDKWTTWLYYSHHTLEDFQGGDDVDGDQFGLGVEYKYNPNVIFALNFIKMSWDDGGPDDNHRIQFRTYVTY
jgi:hypothetical protein